MTKGARAAGRRARKVCLALAYEITGCGNVEHCLGLGAVIHRPFCPRHVAENGRAALENAVVGTLCRSTGGTTWVCLTQRFVDEHDGVAAAVLVLEQGHVRGTQRARRVARLRVLAGDHESRVGVLHAFAVATGRDLDGLNGRAGAVIGGIVGGYARRGIGALVVRGGRAVDRGAEADQARAPREGLWRAAVGRIVAVVREGEEGGAARRRLRAGFAEQNIVFIAPLAPVVLVMPSSAPRKRPRWRAA